MSSIAAELTLENKQFKAKLGEALAEVKKLKAAAAAEGQGIGSSLAGGMKRGMGQLIGMAGIPIGIGAAVMGLKSMAEHFDQIEDSAGAMNSTVEGVQRLQYMAAGTVTPFEQMSGGLLKIKRALFDVDDEAKEKALKSIGLDAANFMSLDADKAFIALANGFQTAQKSGVGVEEMFDLVNKSAPDLIPALRTSADELQRMGDKAVVSASNLKVFTENLGKAKMSGIEFTNSSVNKFSALRDAIDDIGAGFLGMFDGGPGFMAAGIANEMKRTADSNWDAVDAEEARLNLAKLETEQAEKLKSIRDADRADRERDAAAKKAIADRAAAESATATEQDIRIKELRNSGRYGAADKLQKQAKEESEFHKLRDQHPELGEEWARNMARRNAAADDRAAHPGRITGFSSGGSGHMLPAGQRFKSSALDWIEAGGMGAASLQKHTRDDMKFPQLDQLKHLQEIAGLLRDK